MSRMINMRKETYPNLINLIDDFEIKFNTSLRNRIEKVKTGDTDAFNKFLKISHVAYCQSGKSIGIPTILSSIHACLNENKTELKEIGCNTYSSNQPVESWIRMGTTDKELISQHTDEDNSVLRNFTYKLNDEVIFETEKIVNFDISKIFHNSTSPEKEKSIIKSIKKTIEKENCAIVIIDDESHRATKVDSRWDKFIKEIESFNSNVPKIMISTTATPDYLSEEHSENSSYNIFCYQEPGEEYWGFEQMEVSNRFKDVNINNYSLKNSKSSDDFVKKELVQDWKLNEEKSDYKYYVFRLGSDRNQKKSARHTNLTSSITKIFNRYNLNVPVFQDFSSKNYKDLMKKIGGKKRLAKPMQNEILIIKNGLGAGVNIDKSHISIWYETTEDVCDDDLYGNTSTHIQRLGRCCGYDAGESSIKIFGSLKCVKHHVEWMKDYREKAKVVCIDSTKFKFHATTGTNVQKSGKRSLKSSNILKPVNWFLGSYGERPGLNLEARWFKETGKKIQPHHGRIRSNNKTVDLARSLLVTENFSSQIKFASKGIGNKSGKLLFLIKFDKYPYEIKDDPTFIYDKLSLNNMEKSHSISQDFRDRWCIVYCKQITLHAKNSNITSNKTLHSIKHNV